MVFIVKNPIFCCHVKLKLQRKPLATYFSEFTHTTHAHTPYIHTSYTHTSHMYTHHTYAHTFGLTQIFFPENNTN